MIIPRTKSERVVLYKDLHAFLRNFNPKTYFFSVYQFKGQWVTLKLFGYLHISFGGNRYQNSIQNVLNCILLFQKNKRHFLKDRIMGAQKVFKKAEGYKAAE